MTKGMTLPIFPEINIKKRLELLKLAGFDALIFSFDPKFEKYNGTVKEMLGFCKKIGLKTNCGHAAYHEPEVDEFWLDTPRGNQIFKDYMNTLKMAHNYKIKNVTFHLNSSYETRVTNLGLGRLKMMADYADAHEINIGIENLFSYHELQRIFSKLSNKSLGMTYDSGHEHCFTPGANFLSRFGSRLKVLHLHDNDGSFDQHIPPFMGTIDWDKMASDLAQANQVALDAEVKLTRPQYNYKVTEEELFNMYRTIYQSLTKLESMIEEKKEILAK